LIISIISVCWVAHTYSHSGLDDTPYEAERQGSEIKESYGVLIHAAGQNPENPHYTDTHCFILQVISLHFNQED